jgi:heme-degrading monooxygenase HmoA
MTLHLAQMNIGRMRAPIESDIMARFVARLAEINALADASDGFVWRFQGEGGNATYLRPYDDPLIIFNMSVWASVEALQRYAYSSAHRELLRARQLVREVRRTVPGDVVDSGRSRTDGR